MTYGLLLAGGGLLFFGTQLQVDTSFWLMLPVFMIMGHGMASVMAPMTAAVMNSVGPQRAGLGSAMTNTSREVGGVFGIALLGTILTTKLKSSLAPTPRRASGLTSAQQTRSRIAGGHGTLDPTLLSSSASPRRRTPRSSAAFDSAFMDGFHVALLVGGTVLVVRGRRRVPVHPRPAHRARAGAGRSRSGGRRGVDSTDTRPDDSRAIPVFIWAESRLCVGFRLLAR